MFARQLTSVPMWMLVSLMSPPCSTPGSSGSSTICGAREGVTLIEAELKARLADPAAVRDRLRNLAAEEISVYLDTYYDRSAHPLGADGRELRLRVIETAGLRRTVLTYKEPAADQTSGSKPEHETTVADPAVIDVIFRALGRHKLVAFHKNCANYRYTAKDRDMLATMVTVPEIEGSFLELETMAAEAELTAALGDVRAVLGELGIGPDDLTTELYTDAVMRARNSPPA